MKTFGELTREEQLKLFSDWLDGKEIQRFFQGQWVNCEYSISWSRPFIYRSIEKPDFIYWDHVNEDFKYMARDKDGKAYLYKEEPYISGNFWQSRTSSVKLKADYFSSYKDNGRYWEHSLVIRPKLLEVV